MSSSLSDLVDNLSEIYNKNVKHAWKEKVLNQSVILSSLKIIKYVTNVKNVKKYG